MKLNQAISTRISDLCSERNMTQYQLYMLSGIPQSTLSAIKYCKYPSVKLRILQDICNGFDISLIEFFDCPLFTRENLDNE